MHKEHAGKRPLPTLIMQLYRAQAQLYERHFGMSQSRLNLIRELGQAGEISQAELVQLLDMEGTLVTRFVKDMEAAELLTRRRDPRDNRFTLVTLSPTGLDLAQRMAAFTHTLEAQLLEGFGEEAVTIIREGVEQIQEKYVHLAFTGDVQEKSQALHGSDQGKNLGK